MNGGRLTGVVRRAARSPVLDVVLAAVLGCYAALDALRTADFPQPHGVSAALVAVSAAFLALRRVRPLTALTGALGGLAVIYLALGHYEAGAAVLIGVIATYSAGAYARNLPFAVAVVFAFGVTTGLRQPAAEALPDMAWSWAGRAGSHRSRSAGCSRCSRSSRRWPRPPPGRNGSASPGNCTTSSATGWA